MHEVSDAERLQRYLLQALAEAGDAIHPELRDLVSGSSETEIDLSIAKLVVKTASIEANARQAALSAAQEANRELQAGPDREAAEHWRTDQLGGFGDQAADVGTMDMAAYEAFRQAAGIGQTSGNYGLFGQR